VNYQASRLARIEGRSQGCDDMVLLNASGRVAEASGSALLLIRNGIALTPCHTEGALESITIDICESIAHSINIPFERRPIDRTELLIADEIGLCGTLTELVPASRIDGRDIESAGPILTRMRECYFDVCRGRAHLGDINITRLDELPAD
jgi:branched-chain amino acid aminotransferase